jgi:hypothetical protein
VTRQGGVPPARPATLSTTPRSTVVVARPVVSAYRVSGPAGVSCACGGHEIKVGEIVYVVEHPAFGASARNFAGYDHYYNFLAFHQTELALGALYRDAQSNTTYYRSLFS